LTVLVLFATLVGNKIVYSFMRKIWEQYPREFHEWDDVLQEHEASEPVVTLSYLREECQNIPELFELYTDMENSFYNYAEIFFKFNRILKIQNQESVKFRAEYGRLDEDRHNIHNATIDSIFILARNMEKAGLDGSWIKKVGQGNRENRAAVQALVINNIYYEYKYRHKEGKI